jgi:hypothetical protein
MSHYRIPTGSTPAIPRFLAILCAGRLALAGIGDRNARGVMGYTDDVGQVEGLQTSMAPPLVSWRPLPVRCPAGPGPRQARGMDMSSSRQIVLCASVFEHGYMVEFYRPRDADFAELATLAHRCRSGAVERFVVLQRTVELFTSATLCQRPGAPMPGSIQRVAHFLGESSAYEDDAPMPGTIDELKKLFGLIFCFWDTADDTQAELQTTLTGFLATHVHSLGTHRIGLDALKDLQTPTQLPDFVTLDQAAGMVHKSKRTLERYKTSGELPDPTVEGGAGRADLWEWQTMRAWLTTTFGIELPERFPASRKR